MTRFDGLVRLYGDGVQRLAGARVLVVGLGGVGSWAIEALARSGVGHLVLMDGDDVCESNINRQLHAVQETVGRAKVEVMAERIRSIHPLCSVTTLQEFFRRDAAERPFAEPPDYVIDAVDGVTAKAALIGAARRLGVPVITCGAAGGRVDPSRIRVADLTEAQGDRLLMFVRKKLRKHYGFPPRGRKPFGVPCVFSTEPPKLDCANEPDPATLDALVDDRETPLNCEGRLGSAVFVTAVFGFFAAARVVTDLVSRAGQKAGES